MNARRLSKGVTFSMTLLLSARLASADELKSGLQVGERRGCLSVIWLVNYPYDGFFHGCMPDNLHTSGRVAIVFIRAVDDRVAELVLALDLQVTEWGNKEGPKAFVCGVGGVEHEHLARLKKEAVDVPLTVLGRGAVAKKQAEVHKLNDKAEVTVVVYQSVKVTANFAFANTKDLTRQRIKEVVKALTAGASDRR